MRGHFLIFPFWPKKLGHGEEISVIIDCQEDELSSSMYILVVILAVSISSVVGTSAETVTLLAGYEPSESGVTVTSGEVTITYLEGGTLDSTYGEVPETTEGDYVIGLIWTEQSDRKVEIRHEFADTFDLDGQDFIQVDCLFATESAMPVDPCGIVGIWDDVFGWAQSANPTVTCEWFTAQFDVSGLDNTGLDHISALLWEKMGDVGDLSGTIFIDNLRLVSGSPSGLIATGHDSRIDLRWEEVTVPNLQGYNIYRASSLEGPYSKLNSSVHTVSVYSDFLGANGETYFYYVTSVLGGESQPWGLVWATSAAMNDDELLESVQEAAFRYFWDFAHPVSGLSREGLTHERDICTIGGTGMGFMNIVVGVERGFISRAQGTGRVLKMLTFLDEKASRYHGAWSHWLNGSTGQTIPFGGSGSQDNGGDLVETAFLIEGMLTARQYFDDSIDAVETQIRDRISQMWEEVEWDWYRRYPDGESLYWHWSPDYGWAMNMTITGYNEAMIVYLLAIASPTHPMPASSYYNGWARESWYQNNDPNFYGIKQWVGTSYGGPLFFAHYSFLGFDPRYKSDAYCNYFDNSRNISLLHHAYCVDNPGNYEGYSELVWGLTASTNPWGYLAHAPVYNDNGTIAPTAAISSIPYTPAESIATLKHFYHTYGDRLWGPFGFIDAFNLEEDPNWFSDTYLAIDQGTIAVMIENYRTQLCWALFMSNPEIGPMLEDIGWTCSGTEGDFNGDCQVGVEDVEVIAHDWLDVYFLSDLARISKVWMECMKLDQSQCFSD